MRLSLAHGRALDLATPAVMGILNVTPDSFSDGGRFTAIDSAVDQAREMLAQGATLIDVGGESTRPGAVPVSEHEELARVVPVIERIVREFDCLVSIDTMKPAVMRAAIAAGAHLVNDVNALQAPGAIETVRDTGAAACMMHMQGTPRTMQIAPSYTDVVTDVIEFLAARTDACMAAGISHDRLLIDPGFGFGKRLEHNLALFAAMPLLTAMGFPVVVGVSRKGMIGEVLGLPVDRRLNGGLSAAAIAVWEGAAVIRTHDVQATVETVKFAAAVRRVR